MTFPDWFFPKQIIGTKGGKFTELRAEQILSTIEKLEQRIAERFPDSGLRQVCREFHHLAVESEGLAVRLRRPIWVVRVVSWLAVGLVMVLVWGIGRLLFEQAAAADTSVSEILQGSEAAINELIFLSVALFFLTSLETRLKRQVALKALHRLRSIAHVVDMHQLTKDPAFLLGSQFAENLRETEASPVRSFSSFELSRYLDYCSEMLALMSKIAALFAQNMDDEVVLGAVNDLENLTHGLSGKIWQKIMILDLAVE